MRRAARTAAMTMVLVTAMGTSAAWASDPVSFGLQRVSQGDPAASCTAGAESGTLYPSAEVEPYTAVNPWNPHQTIGVFQQDRWSDGGAHAGGEVWSSDGTHFKEQMLPFGVCAGPGATNYERVSDLWVSWGPDGTAYASGLEFDDATARNGVGAATSFDGGATWKYAQPVIADDDAAIGNDKNSVTADPDHPGTAYQVWDRLDAPVDANGDPLSFDGPGYISITHDHGKTWTTPSVMVDTSVIPFTQTIGNVIVPDARTGKLYDFFNLISYTDASGSNVVSATYDYEVSSDEGATWSTPHMITPDTSVLEVDPNNAAQFLRAGGGLPSPAIDPVTGELYLAYEGSDFSGGAFDQIQLVSSTDHGATWSAPVRISRDPAVAAFTPAIAVDFTGTVHVTYYDLRDLPATDTTTLPTSTWLLSFPRGHESAATEQRIAPDFDWLLAPDAGGHMLGDYNGITDSGLFGVRPIIVATTEKPGDPTDVYTGTFQDCRSAPPVPAAGPRAAAIAATRVPAVRKTYH